ncbi:MAG: cation transporter [Caldilineae bacterium]|nr:MAG: cation transporter [Caldilineae bacterium]
MQWSTFWVDSTDRPDWLERVKQVFDLPGVAKVLPDPENGQVRVRYNPEEITVFQLSAHLRAAGL